MVLLSYPFSPPGKAALSTLLSASLRCSSLLVVPNRSPAKILISNANYIQPTPRAFAILAIARANNLELDIIYAEKEHKENYAKLLEYNPLGQVPVFVGADGMVLTECIPIAMYSEFICGLFSVIYLSLKRCPNFLGCRVSDQRLGNCDQRIILKKGRKGKGT